MLLPYVRARRQWALLLTGVLLGIPVTAYAHEKWFVDPTAYPCAEVLFSLPVALALGTATLALGALTSAASCATHCGPIRIGCGP